MYQAQGQVSKIMNKAWSGTPEGLFSFQLNGDRSYYRMGQVRPQFTEGQTITFQYEEKNGNKNVKWDTVTIDDASPSGAPSAPNQGTMQAPVNGANLSRNDYFAEKDRYDKEVRQPAIEYQAARNAAIAMVECLSRAGAVPGITEKTAAPKRSEIIDAMVDEYTQKYFEELPHKLNAEGVADGS